MSEQTPAPAEPTPAPETPPAPEMVPKAEMEKVLADLHKWKNQAKELSVKSAAEREKLLVEQGRWEELAKEKDARLRELEERDAKTRQAFVDEKKFSAVKEAALKSGIRSEALPDLELVSLDKVQVETTSTGRVNVLGVEHAIEQLKLSRPHWFGGTKTVISGSDPQVNSTTTGIVNQKDLIKLSMEAQKTGDYTAYEKAFKQFRQQK
jgi:hypothetical protein